MSDPTFMPAVEQARMVAARAVSPVELVEHYAKRIEALDGEVNAFVTLAVDDALEQARKAEAAVASGDDLAAFHGVPTAIKDLTETAGIRTTYSTKLAAEFVPDADAHVVRRMKDAGFIVVGKTNTPEFGLPPVTESELNGPCRNPWNLGRTSGGSSGGAAAAVAAGMVPVAHGSDGGGSIRIPASCCGLFGLKPARGRISWGPLVGESMHGLATHGPMARSVEDAAALLDVMAGYEVGDPYWAPAPHRPFGAEVGVDPGRLRIGLSTDPPIEAAIDPVVVEAVDDAARLLEELGHHVERVAPEWHDPEIFASFVTVFQSSTALWQQIVDPSLTEPLTRAMAEATVQTTTVDYLTAVNRLHTLSRRVVAFWDDFDLLLTPTLARSPVPIGWIYEDEDPWVQLARCAEFVPFTPAFNMTGQPAASVPLYWSQEGLPIGVQLVARPADEATLIRVGAQLQEARDWTIRRPPEHG